MRRGSWHVGTSGWSYQHWRGLFYPSDLPQSRWFTYYCSQFATVELNNTFYRLPAVSTFITWRRQAPPGFIFAVKANQYITHIKRLRDPEESVERFLERTRLLGDHLGPILYQLPLRFPCHLERLEHFLATLPGDLTHVVEFRDERWLNDDVLALLERYGVGLCIADLPGLHYPMRATSQTVYVRFHGSQVLYGTCYNQDDLALWASCLSQFVAEGRQVYIYFNNDAEAYAVRNAHEMIQQMVVRCNQMLAVSHE